MKMKRSPIAVLPLLPSFNGNRDRDLEVIAKYVFLVVDLPQ